MADTAATVFPITRSDAEWCRLPTPEQYRVMRAHDIELPDSCTLLREKRQGRFACARCGQALSASGGKFESGTGWPSFDEPSELAVGTTIDRSHGMVRTETRCINCGNHLGHVFNDGQHPATSAIGLAAWR